MIIPICGIKIIIGKVKNMFDILIKNGNIYDGKNGPFTGDVAISGGKISAVGHIDGEAAEVIDAGGRCVTPGFIDIHRHADMAVFRHGFGEGELMQGLTTIVNGNCGMGPAPVEEGSGLKGYLKPVLGEMLPEADTGSTAGYMASLEGMNLPLNVGMLTGCGTIWAGILGYGGKHPGREDIARFHRILEHELSAGTLGASLGLGYAPECFLTTQELIEGLAPLKDTDIPIAFHMRQEGDGVCRSVEEVAAIGRALNAPVHISHLKAMGRRNWNRRIPEALEIIKAAALEGVDITFDAYPYTAGSTQLMHVLPPDFIEGGTDRVIERLKDAGLRRELGERIAHGTDFDNIAGMVGWDNIVIAAVNTKANRRFEGMTLEGAAKARGEAPLECLCNILIEENCAVTMIDFITCEEDIARILNAPGASVISDSIYPSGGRPHPRLYGSFPRIIQRYVYERRDITLQRAIELMTSEPAAALRLKGKGRIAVGMDADINIFDPKNIRENGSYNEPEKTASGMEYVMINGQIKLFEGKISDEAGGKVIRRRREKDRPI